MDARRQHTGTAQGRRATVLALCAVLGVTTACAAPAADPPAAQVATTPGITVRADMARSGALRQAAKQPGAMWSAPACALPAPFCHARARWPIRSIDTMKLSRDTARDQLSAADIRALVRLDARLHPSHVTVDVYYDDPAYMRRWVDSIHTAGLRVWFRAHWYAWETHYTRYVLPHGKIRTVMAGGTMTPQQYIDATRRFLQTNATLFENGDIFDFCPEPENGAYWLRTYGKGWSWRGNEAAKHAFNVFVRDGVRMAATTLAHRGLGGVLVTAVSVNSSVATRLLSKPTMQRLKMITLDLYPEGKTRDAATAARLLVAEIASVRRKWPLPILIGEHGYARDIAVDDATQARVLAAELAALVRLPYVLGLNYWVDAGGPGYGGYTNLFARARNTWLPRPAASVLARAYTAG